MSGHEFKYGGDIAQIDVLDPYRPRRRRLTRAYEFALIGGMAPSTELALADLKETARNHPGASGGEKRAYRILRSLTHGESCSIIDDFVGLDATRQEALITILSDIASGQTGAIELRE